MNLSGVVSAARRAADRLMTDTCVVSRNGAPDPDAVIDPETGKYPVPNRVTVYSGPCYTLVPGTVSAGKTRQTAGDEATILTSVFKVPATAPKLLVGDRVLFTVSPFNPNLVGMRFDVTGLLPGSHQSTQKVSVEAVVG